MKIGILGTRGIPNYYGGFEQFAEYFAQHLQRHGHEVYVYNSSSHPYKESTYNEINLIHCYDPENKIGTAGQFIFDLNCILDARKRNFDILLQLGYTSNSIWHKLLPKNALIITNMDGLEWKRTKYSRPTQKFLKLAERWAVRSSDFLIADSLGIQSYLRSAYGVDSKYIAYGAEVFEQPDTTLLKEYAVAPYQYNMLIARMEPENNVETILDGAVLANNKIPFLVIGKYNNKFGAYLKDKYLEFEHIRFIGGLYNMPALNTLRYCSNLYFHGHSVGGTNPSLLEAMASNAMIVAHDNEFNQAILKENALYFKNSEQVKAYIDTTNKAEHADKIRHNYRAIKEEFNWETINHQYLSFFKECYERA